MWEAESPTEVSMEIDDCKGGALPSVVGPNEQTQNCREHLSDRSSNEQF